MRGMLMMLLAVGCATEGADPVESELDTTLRVLGANAEVFGCGDVHMVVADASDQRAMRLTISDDLAQAATLAGEPVIAEYALPHPAVDVRVLWGTDVSAMECNDVGMPNVVISGEAVAIEGTVSIEVAPDGWGTEFFPTGHASAMLEQAVFEVVGTGQQGVLDSLVVDDVYVGWLPG